MIDFRPAQAFLRGLRATNERAWFEDHRKAYEQDLIEPAKAFVREAAVALADIDGELVAEARVNGSIFRMNRDLRFSKDKRPYREELGFRFWVGDRKQGLSGFYMRVLPEAIGVATGMWAFDKHSRERYRNAVAGDEGEALAATLTALQARGGHITAEELKRTPKPWTDEHPRASLLRKKGLVVGIEDALDAGPGVVDTIIERWNAIAPVHHFLRDHT
ncbi:MAG: DUF2461 domain-containing protein [Proteobacteria bacterium]|nr:DUF2461 domain-containing protein [Pseudomonadota bacterium]